VVADWVGTGRIPGAVLLVALDGAVVLERAYGWSYLYDYGTGQYPAGNEGVTEAPGIERRADPIRMTPSTLFDLASVTKVMATTLAVMLMVESGDMNVDAPLSRYLPDFRRGGKDSVTLRHLLTHRAGLYQWLPTYYHTTNRDEASEYVRTRPLAWGVGEGRHYSDLGFMLLGLAVEQVADTSLDAFLRERIYRPLGLDRTGFRPLDPPRTANGHLDDGAHIAATSHGNPYEHRMVHDSTFGYRIAGNADAWDGWRRYALRGEVNDANAFHAFGGIAGHAGLFSTASELNVLLQLLLNGGGYGGRQYLNPEVVDTFLASTGQGQALGWQLQAYIRQPSFSHTGFTGTLVLAVPEYDLALVLLTNRQNRGVDEDGLYPDVDPLQRAVVAAVMKGVQNVP
jgi:CubicO group peptidase (beta-lactamase class C family)